jgi:hypothetical protein
VKRTLILLAVALAAALAFGPAAHAGSPHFVDDTIAATRSGDTLTVSGKEAGLGSEESVHIVVEAKAACINPGDNHPQAANKESLTAAGDFPVQRGFAVFSLSLTATFQPSCSPPMTVEFSDVTVSDTTNGVTANIPGTF